jgi:hypothetical protein
MRHPEYSTMRDSEFAAILLYTAQRLDADIKDFWKSGDPYSNIRKAVRRLSVVTQELSFSYGIEPQFSMYGNVALNMYREKTPITDENFLKALKVIMQGEDNG